MGKDSDMTEDEEVFEFYCCLVCGYEDHADEFGEFCPKCGSNLDEVEGLT